MSAGIERTRVNVALMILAAVLSITPFSMPSL
jgi:hypothetical protein